MMRTYGRSVCGEGMWDWVLLRGKESVFVRA